MILSLMNAVFLELLEKGKGWEGRGGEGKGREGR